MVNALIHEHRRDLATGVHGNVGRVVDVWITLWTSGGQPPIANISIFGRSLVDCARSSE
jgi:hypothetical protein